MTRFKDLRAQSEETQAEIAALIGITRAAYSNIENGKREPDFDTLFILAEHYGVTVDYLLGRSDEPYMYPVPPELSLRGITDPEERQRRIDLLARLHSEGFGDSPRSTGGKWIPVLGSVAAGVPISAVEEILDYEEISSELASRGEYFALRIKGASMEPKISEGDVVIVRQQEDCNTGDVAVVLVNGDEATVKRIKKGPEGLMLIPNNPAWEPMFYTNEEIASLPVRILGKVIELRAKF